MIKNIIVFFLLFVPSLALSQQSQIDSLLHVFNDSTKPDTVRLKTMHWLIGAVWWNNTSDARFHAAEQMQQFAHEKKQKKWEALAFMMLGICMADKGNFLISNEYYFKSLKIRDEIGNESGKRATYHNLANNFADMGDNLRALEYYFKSLALSKKSNDKPSEGMALIGISGSYLDMGNNSKALKFQLQALKLCEEIDKEGYWHAASFFGLGEVYSALFQDSMALDCYFKSLRFFPNDTLNEVATAYAGIANIYLKQKKYSLALKYANDALKSTSINNYVYGQKEAHNILYNIYKKTGNIPNALEHHEKYTALKDSLFGEEKLNAFTQKSMHFDFEKKEALTKAQQEKKDAIVEEEKRRQKLFLFSVAGGLLLVLVFAGFIFRSLRVTNKQKQIIEIKNKETEQQKHIIEEKNKDITDSINYAKRIQRAMLPHRKDIWAAFPQSFVLFKPKDIVSGDFYFFSHTPRFSPKGGEPGRVGSEASLRGVGGLCFIAAGDCTGHGVPGAFMSMVGAGKLTDSVALSSDTSEVLALLNIGVKTALKQSEEDQSATRDGMDIALCSVDTVNRVVKYAGANRPIWIIRKGSTAVEEIKATKKAIGGFTENSQHFDTHEIQLQEGDTFYLSTDGYADTFGKDGKKMMTKRFKEILLGIQDKTMKEQENYLDDFVENWKGGTEPVDDILVIGIRL